MIRAKKLSLVSARRTLRALYAQSQGYPYAAQLAAVADNPVYADPTANQSTLAAFGQETGVANIFPGAVLDLVDPETVDLASDDGVGSAAFGLSANFVGGDLDELADLGEIGVWRGPGSVWIVLAPVFDSALSSDSAGQRVGAITDGGGAQGVVGEADSGSTGIGALLNPLGANAVVIDLQVPTAGLPIS